MPYQKRRYKRKSKKSSKSAGKLALKKVNKILSTRELKKLELDVSTTSTETALINPMNLVATGDSGIEREGNVISLENFLCNYSIRMNTSDDFCNVRVMVIQDNQVDGAAPSIGDILQYTGSEKIITSPLNLDGALRFKKLYDRVHSFNQGAKPNGAWKYYRNLGGIKMRYKGTTASISNVLNKALFFIHVSDETTNAPVITYQTRVRFSDM